MAQPDTVDAYRGITGVPSRMPGGGDQAATPWPTVAKWLLGIGGTWLVLSALAEFEDTAELSVAFSVVIMGAVLFEFSPQAFKNLGFLQ